MMCYPGMLVSAAEKAGMKVPKDPDNFDAKVYPHFNIFCNVQLNRAIRWGEHWENAEVVAKIPDGKLKTITLAELIDMGLGWHC